MGSIRKAFQKESSSHIGRHVAILQQFVPSGLRKCSEEGVVL
jgi:hypothetical protein